MGEYYIKVRIGEQDVHLQIDTGSSTMAVPLKECSNCVKSGRALDVRETSSAKLLNCSSAACQTNTCHVFRICRVCSPDTRACCSINNPKKCGFYLSYADGSTASGALVESDVSLGELGANLHYGGILSASSGFENKLVDGIFGMAYKSLACNPTCVMPLFDKLVKESKVKEDVFSICTGRGGGTLTLGGVNASLHEGEIGWSSMPQRQVRHFYDVAVKSVSADGKLLELPHFTNAIVDSGTTVLVIAPSAFLTLKKHFLANYCDVPGLCVDSKNHSESKRKIASWFEPGYCALLTKEHIRKLPTITITLKGGVNLELEPEDYMLKYVPHSSYSLNKLTFHCLGISYLEGLDRMENNVILGNTVLQKYLTVYDRKNERIGFAKSKSCLGSEDRSASPPANELSEDHGGNKFVPKNLLWGLLTLVALLAWVAVLSFCGKVMMRRSNYEPIDAQ